MGKQRYYPVSLDIAGQTCVVVGGGRVAERKTISLLECEAMVRVVSPGLTPTLESLAADGRIQHLARSFAPFCLDGALLVVSATDDPEINRQVSEECRRRGILVNVVDAPRLCSFIVPSIIRRGTLTIAVSTGGASPLLSRRIRQEIEERYGPEYEEALKELAALRQRLKRAIPSSEDRKKTFETLMQEGLLNLLLEGRKDEAEERIRKCILSLSG